MSLIHECPQKPPDLLFQSVVKKDNTSHWQLMEFKSHRLVGAIEMLLEILTDDTCPWCKLKLPQNLEDEPQTRSG